MLLPHLVVLLLGTTAARREVFAGRRKDDEVTIPGRYIVRLCGESHRSRVAKFIERRNASKLAPHFSGNVGRHVEYLKHLPSFVTHEMSASAAEELRWTPGVCDVAPVQRTYHRGIEAAMDGAYWNLDRINQPTLPLDGESRKKGGKGTNVFVIDTGLDTTHREFATNGREVRIVADTSDAANPDTGDQLYWPGLWADEPFSINNDMIGHGTVCSSLVGGVTLGQASEANLYMIKISGPTGSATTEAEVHAFNRIAELAVKGFVDPMKTLVSISFGGECGDGTVAYCREAAPSVLAVKSLDDLGIPVVVAAGNDGDDACYYSPGAGAAINVAASSYIDVAASWSNYGSCIDIVAPGVDVAGAVASLAPEHWETYIDEERTFWRGSGTSYAAPLVAGVLANYTARFGSTKLGVNALYNSAARGQLFPDPDWCATNDRLLQIVDDPDPSEPEEIVCEIPEDRPRGWGSAGDEAMNPICDMGNMTGLEPVSKCGPGETLFKFVLEDSFGDGWNGACFGISNADCPECSPSYSGTLEYGSSSERMVCLACDQTYTVNVGGGKWENEVSWSLGDLKHQVPGETSVTCADLTYPDEVCDAQGNPGLEACDGGSMYLLALVGDGWSEDDDGSRPCFHISNEECGSRKCPVYSGSLEPGESKFREICLNCNAPGTYALTAGPTKDDESLRWLLGEMTGNATPRMTFTCEDLEPVDPPAPMCPGDKTGIDVTECGEGETFFPLVLQDALGDGWNGACFEINAGSMTYGGTLEQGRYFDGDADVTNGKPRGICLPCGDDDTYEITVGGGESDAEISWSLGTWTGRATEAPMQFTCGDIEKPVESVCNDEAHSGKGVVTCGPDETAYDLVLASPKAATWHGACFLISNDECGDACPPFSGTLEAGWGEVRTVCLKCESPGSYTLDIDASWFNTAFYRLGGIQGWGPVSRSFTCNDLDAASHPSDDDLPVWPPILAKRKTAMNDQVDAGDCAGFDIDGVPGYTYDEVAFASHGGAYVALNYELNTTAAPGFVECDGNKTSPECDVVAAVQGTEMDDSYSGIVLEVDDLMAVSSRVCAVKDTMTSYDMYFVDEMNATDFAFTTTLAMADGDTYDYRTWTAGQVRVAGECSLAVGMEPWSQEIMIDATFAPPVDRTVAVDAGAYLSLQAGSSSYPGIDITCILQFSPTSDFAMSSLEEEEGDDDGDDDDSYTGMDAGAIMAVFISLFVVAGLAEAFYLGLFRPILARFRNTKSAAYIEMNDMEPASEDAAHEEAKQFV